MKISIGGILVYLFKLVSSHLYRYVLLKANKFIHNLFIHNEIKNRYTNKRFLNCKYFQPSLQLRMIIILPIYNLYNSREKSIFQFSFICKSTKYLLTNFRVPGKNYIRSQF